MTTLEPPGLDILYTRAEAAALLKCPESWLRDQVTAGTIPHIRLGKIKGVRFARADLEEITHLRRRSPVTADPEAVRRSRMTRPELTTISDLRPTGRRGNRKSA